MDSLTIVILIIFILIGIIFGRIFCGKICPYGLVQDLLYKIPFPKKIHAFKADKYLRYLKYFIILFLIGTNTFGLFTTASTTSPDVSVLTVVGFFILVLLSVFISRPFCKYLCPVGGLNGLFNLLPSNKYKVNQDTCNKCGACMRVCKMDIEPYKASNSVECVRCGKCKKNCPFHAIESGFMNNKL